MTPELVTPPVGQVVSIDELRAHLRVDGTDEDALIASLQDAAVGHLDGWRGVLGRAILPQTWRQAFDGWGTLRLALPDVTDVTVTYTDAAGDEQPATTSDLQRDYRGPYVVAAGPDTARVTVTYVCAMPVEQLPVVQAVVKMLVAHWFQHREAAGPSMAETPMAVQSLVDAMRWRTA